MPAWVRLAIVLAFVPALESFAVAQDTRKPLVAATPAPATEQVAAIEKASSPAEALAVFSRVQKADPDAPGVAEAFVRRMVQLDAPLQAEKTAQAVIKSDPKNGLAWAVVGFANAMHDDTATAAEQLAVAARYAPAEAFVQRIGGQLVAWYDTRDRDFSPTAEELRAVRQIRTLLGGRVVFADAYREAKGAYAQPQMAPPAAANADTGPVIDNAQADSVTGSNVIVSGGMGFYGGGYGGYTYGYPYGPPYYTNYGYPYYVNYGYPTYINYGYPYPGDGGYSVWNSRHGQRPAAWRGEPRYLTPPGHRNAPASADPSPKQPQARPTTGNSKPQNPARPQAAPPQARPQPTPTAAPAQPPKPAPAPAPTPSNKPSGTGTKR